MHHCRTCAEQPTQTFTAIPPTPQPQMLAEPVAGFADHGEHGWTPQHADGDLIALVLIALVAALLTIAVAMML